MAAQRQIPGGSYVNETATLQRQVPGFQYVNETSGAGAAAGPGILALPPLRGAMRQGGGYLQG